MRGRRLPRPGSRYACSGRRLPRPGSRSPNELLFHVEMLFDDDLPLKRALHRTPFGNFEKALPLLVSQLWTEQSELLGDLVQEPLTGFAVCAILGVDALVLQGHFNAV